MVKKVFVGFTIAIILVVGVFGLVKSSYAQVTNASSQTSEVNTLRDPQTLEYENMDQNSAVNGDIEAVQAQNRTRLSEMEDGECDADCDPQQIRDQMGVNNEGNMLQERTNQGEFDCTGDCVPQQLRLNDGTYGNGAVGEPNTSANGICDGAGILKGQGQGYKGNK